MKRSKLSILLLVVMILSSGCAKFGWQAMEGDNESTLNEALGSLNFVGSCYFRNTDEGEYYCNDVYWPQASIDTASSQGLTRQQMASCPDDPIATFSNSKCPTATAIGRCDYKTLIEDPRTITGAFQSYWYPESTDPLKGQANCLVFDSLPYIEAKWIPM